MSRLIGELSKFLVNPSRISQLQLAGMPKDQFYRIYEVSKRIPDTVEGRIGLLFAFMRSDLSHLTKREALFLDSILKGISITYNPASPALQIEFKLTPTTKQEVQEMRGIQQQLREGFASLLSSKKLWTPPGRPEEMWLSRDTLGGKSKIRKHFIAEFPFAFWLAVAEWLEAAGHRLKSCPECETPFVATKRQAYCSTKCSQRVRTRRWYAVHKEEAKEKRHQAYLSEVRKKHPKAKVQRRVPVKGTGRQEV